MTLRERLDFMIELISCNFKIYRWQYRPDLTLAYMTESNDVYLGSAIDMLDFRDILQQMIEDHVSVPMYYDSTIGLLWIVELQWDRDEVQAIHLLGPVFTGKNSYHVLKRDLDSHNIGVKMRSVIFREIEKVPVIPGNILGQYAVMLHHVLTGEDIVQSEVKYAGRSELPDDTAEVASDDHRGIWAFEQKLLQAFREGNSDYMEYVDASRKLSSGVKFDVGDSLRKDKNNAIVLMTLVSRESIEGGLNPAISYSLQDAYMKRIEECKTQSEVASVSTRMMSDYITRVQDASATMEMSKQIRNCCDYINLHLSDALSIDFLANRFGYTEYYFSHKFHKEVGCPVKEYIKKAKIEQAKILLSTTTKSIQDICEELSFGSRSNFSTSFREATGIPPSQFRKENWKM